MSQTNNATAPVSSLALLVTASGNTNMMNNITSVLGGRLLYISSDGKILHDLTALFKQDTVRIVIDCTVLCTALGYL